jgi:hypothetical protein
MKKVVLVVAFALIGFVVQAQEGFKIGVNAQLPVGDAADVYSFGLSLDLLYMFEVSESFDIGITTGFSNAFLKSEFKDFGDPAQFIPIAAAARFKASEDFSIGADLGYALGINEGNDGGFYYRPMVGYDVSEMAQLTLSYSGVSVKDADFTFSTINLGVLFSL